MCDVFVGAHLLWAVERVGVWGSIIKYDWLSLIAQSNKPLMGDKGGGGMSKVYFLSITINGA